MKRFLATVALASLLASPALADGTIDTLLGAGAIVGTESIPIFQTANPAVKATATAIGNAGSLTGDVTKSVSSTTTTLATVNANVGSFGSATQCTAFTTNAKGLITAASATTCTPAIASVTGLGTGVATFLATPTSANLAAALTDETGTGANVFGTAPTISSPTINTAATFGFITGSTQCLHVSTTGVLSGTGSDCGSGSGAVSSVTGGTGVTVSPTTGAVVVSTTVTQRNNTTTSDTLVAGDAGTVVTENNAGAVAVGIAQAGTTGFASGQYWTLKNKGAGLVTITPTTSTIDGVATLTVSQNQSIDFYSDGANYWTLPGKPVNAAIASGTATLGTSAIASGACATVVTVSATGVATTDVVSFGYNGDPTAVTGYGASATGAVLTVYPYPTANNVNVKVCNSTSGSITPGAMTLNWRVVR